MEMPPTPSKNSSPIFRSPGHAPHQVHAADAVTYQSPESETCLAVGHAAALRKREAAAAAKMGQSVL